MSFILRVVGGQQWGRYTAHHEVSSNGSNSYFQSGDESLEYERRHQVFWVVCDFTQSQFTDAWMEPQIKATTASLHILFEYSLTINPSIRRDIVWAARRAIAQIYSKGKVRRSKIPQNCLWWNPFDKEAMQDLLKYHFMMPCCERTKKTMSSCTKNIKNDICYVIILLKFLTELS